MYYGIGCVIVTDKKFLCFFAFENQCFGNILQEIHTLFEVSQLIIHRLPIILLIFLCLLFYNLFIFR